MTGRGASARPDPDLPKAAGVVEELVDALSNVDVFVNNAGTGDPTATFYLSPTTGSGGS